MYVSITNVKRILLVTFFYKIEARLGKLEDKRADLKKELLGTFRRQIKEK